MFINIEGDAFNNEVYFSRPRRDKDLIEEIFSSLQKIQNRKHRYEREDWTNDELRDSLTDKGFSVADQSRHGRSGSDKKENYSSGEVDLVIKDSEKRGTVIAMIEALELKSAGPKNKSIPYHINKLLKRYDTAGNEKNFIIVYSRAKNFLSLWNKYKKIVDNHFDNFSEIEEKGINKSDIKIGMNSYDRNGKRLALYHFVVNMYSE
jgi:hypothetical protein